MEELQKQIDVLTKRLDELSNSVFIPYSVEQAFKERLGSVQAIGKGTATTQTIDTSGATAVVPAQPSGTIKVKYKEAIYELLYK